MQPASVVEDLSFVSMLDPHYDIPSRRTLMKRLPTNIKKSSYIHILKILPQVKYVSLTYVQLTFGHHELQKTFNYNYAFHSFVGTKKFGTCYDQARRFLKPLKHTASSCNTNHKRSSVIVRIP